MKNNKLLELTPVYIHETSYSADDEISLVDLMVVVLQRKVMFATIMSIFIALGVAVALYTPKTYTFSTVVEIGSQIINDSIQPFESPHALSAKLQHSYIPQILTERKQLSTEDQVQPPIRSSVPGDSNIIIIEIQGTVEQTKDITDLLQLISQRAVQDHTRIFQFIKGNLEERLTDATNKLESLQNTSENNEARILQNLITSLSSQLANLRNTRELLPHIRSINPTGTSRKSIVIAFTAIGFFLGLFAVFITEFLSKVKYKMDKDKS